MNNPKIIYIMKSFSNDDLKKFHDYLKSPIVNKSRGVIRLFEIYKKNYPEFKNENLNKEIIFKVVFQEKIYNDDTFRKLNSLLLKHAESFLSYSSYVNDTFAFQEHLLKGINNRKLFSLFTKQFNEISSMMKKTMKKDLNYFFNTYTLLLQKDLYNSYVNRYSNDDTMQVEKYLAIFFVLNILEIQEFKLYQNKIYEKENYSFLRDDFVECLLKILPEDLIQLPQVQIYYNALMLQKTREKIYFNKLKGLLRKSSQIMGKERLYNLYTVMIDYIKSTFPLNDYKTKIEIFQLRKEIIEKRIFPDNYIISIFFLNMVKSGLKIKEFDWTFNFIENYHHLIFKEYRESTTVLSYAYFYFEKKQFEKSLEHCSKFLSNSSEEVTKAEMKILTFKCLYELEFFDSALSLIDTYKHYLSRTKLLNKHYKKQFFEIINISNHLLNLRLNYFKKDKNHLTALKNEIINSKYLQGNDWHIEKLVLIEKLVIEPKQKVLSKTKSA